MDPAKLHEICKKAAIRILRDARARKDDGLALEAIKVLIQLMERMPPEGFPNSWKRPCDEAWLAWGLRHLLGYERQQEIADEMSRKLGRRIHQGQVSRWLTEVDEWRAAGSWLPEPPRLNRKPTPMDPLQIDLGPRQDGRAQRQRPKTDGR